jgi:hypothetical protein
VVCPNQRIGKKFLRDAERQLFGTQLVISQYPCALLYSQWSMLVFSSFRREFHSRWRYDSSRGIHDFEQSAQSAHQLSPRRLDVSPDRFHSLLRSNSSANHLILLTQYLAHGHRFAPPFSLSFVQFIFVTSPFVRNAISHVDLRFALQMSIPKMLKLEFRVSSFLSYFISIRADHIKTSTLSIFFSLFVSECRRRRC